MAVDNAFMEMVQLHERTWGLEQYGGRPSLAELLSRPIVVMWIEMRSQPPDSKRVQEARRTLEEGSLPARFSLSAHDNIEELNDLLMSMILAGKATSYSNRRISKVYIKQKPVKITGIRLMAANE